MLSDEIFSCFFSCLSGAVESSRFVPGVSPRALGSLSNESSPSVSPLASPAFVCSTSFFFRVDSDNSINYCLALISKFSSVIAFFYSCYFCA